MFLFTERKDLENSEELKFMRGNLLELTERFTVQ